MLPLIITAFVLSGAAGLIYESVWSRYIGLFVGHSAYAQVIVLAVFLGGMAIGAAGVGRFSERIRRPFVWYAGIELGVAAGGLLFHTAFQFVTNFAYDSLFPSLGGPSLQIAKWTVAALLILPQSVLLGATFPLMSAGLLRAARAQGDAVSRTGEALSLLYFSNSFGASVGVLISGFVLVGLVGLPGTLASAAVANMLAAAVMFVVAGWLNESEIAPMTAADAPPAKSLEQRDARAVRRALIIVAAGTAVASFIYEITWVRLLSLVLGSATHSFELMLSAFILGLALGALWMRSRADAFQDPLRALAIVQWVMGVLALATAPLYMMSFNWAAWWLETLARNDNGYHMFAVVRYAFCLVVMLPATFCAGMTLPLITRTAMAAGGGERAIGTIYSVNTVGSIIGAGLGGLVIIPLLQLKGALMLGAAIDMALGVMLFAMFFRFDATGRRRLLITGAGMAIVLVNVGLTQHFDRGILTSGVYRYGAVPDPGARRVAFYRDGRTATVSVRGDGDQGYSLATNGKPDASLTREWLHPMAEREPRRPIGGDQVTQVFLPIITLAHAPHAQTAAVIGFGSGVSSHTLLGSPALRELTTVEIEPAMIEGAKFFRPANRRVYDDARSHIVVDDAKSFFASAGRRFDLIMSEPSNPWVSGVAGLFTDEFYGRIKRYLTDDGVFGQWLHLYEIDDELVAEVIAAVHRNFPAYEIFYVSSVDILIVATPAKSLRAPDWRVVMMPNIAGDLARFRSLSPELFEGLRATNRDALAPYLESDVTINSDFHPYLDLGAERTRFEKSQAVAFIGLGTDRFPLGLVLAGHRTPFGFDVLPAVRVTRTEALANGAALRANFVPPDTGTDADQLRRSRFRWQTMRSVMDKGPPANWGLWLGEAVTADADLHAGTVGVADTAFFHTLLDYATRNHAPERVTASLQFLRAISAWDWPAADSAGDRVLDLGSQAVGLALSGDLLRDGLVVAKLRNHDAVGARRAFDMLAAHGTRPREDLRNQLLEAWIRRAEVDAKRASSPPVRTP